MVDFIILRIACERLSYMMKDQCKQIQSKLTNQVLFSDIWYKFHIAEKPPVYKSSSDYNMGIIGMKQLKLHLFCPSVYITKSKRHKCIGLIKSKAASQTSARIWVKRFNKDSVQWDRTASLLAASLFQANVRYLCGKPGSETTQCFRLLQMK